MKQCMTIGIDIAKNYIQLHGADSHGKALLKKRVTRENFLTTMANLPTCLIGMEACGGAHYWAKQLTQLGFTVKLMNPRKVKKYVDNHKNDANDAQACAEAVSRSNMTFVPIKNETQLDIQAMHRVRSYYLKQQVGLMNMIRGLLLELGIAVPKGKNALINKLRILLDPEQSQVSEKTKMLLHPLYDDIKRLTAQITHYTSLLEKLAEEEESCQRLTTVPGIGPITATAIMAKIGNGNEFKKGRELSAYLGLVPKQHSSGEKLLLRGISKHGDRYVRQLLIHGGRSSLQAALRKDKQTGLFRKQDPHSQWMRTLAERVGMNKASVAIANKNSRMIVALLKNKTSFKATLAH